MACTILINGTYPQIRPEKDVVTNAVLQGKEPQGRLIYYPRLYSL